MPEFISGLELCEAFFNQAARSIIETHFPVLQYTAGLLGYGSDVLGYDDAVSADHMWGPRFYLFLSDSGIGLKDEILRHLSDELPVTFNGYSVNFSSPNPDDAGVRHPEFVEKNPVSPLVWIQTINEFVGEYLGKIPHDSRDWLAIPEHRLLCFTAGKLFHDALGLAETRKDIEFYPRNERLYLIASQWAIIAEEQAFVKRTAARGDDIGSRIICARIAERLMRLCFLIAGKYAPYSKWFGTAFSRLDIPGDIKSQIELAVSAESINDRERYIVTAQALVGEFQNASGLTDRVDIKIENYFGRDIQVIYADRIAASVKAQISDDALKNAPLIGSVSQLGGMVTLYDNVELAPKIAALYDII